jgi:hypothetical protein
MSLFALALASRVGLAIMSLFDRRGSLNYL